MTNIDLKLLGSRYSPFSVRVKIALNIKSLEYQKNKETLNPKSHLLLDSNPVHKKIPVLLHGDKTICESRIIVEYIKEVWTSGPSIVPLDAHDQAVARFWAAYIDEKWLLSMRNILSAEDDESKKPYFEELEKVLVRVEDVLEKCSRRKAFFGGDQIGFINIAFGSFLSWLSVTETMNGRKVLIEAKTPAMMKWAGRFAANPNVKGLLLETEKLIEFGKALQIKRKAATAASAAK